jgi:hypothetical protein
VERLAALWIRAMVHHWGTSAEATALCHMPRSVVFISGA